MTGADTNLIIRYLTRDDEQQAQKVKSLLDTGESLYINAIVSAEIYWVLKHVYEYPDNAIVLAFDRLLDTRQFHFFDDEVIKKSLAEFIHHPSIEFSDCLIHQINKSEALTTYTFDKKATDLNSMELLP